MRKLLIFACMMALTGCAWLGFGNDSESTASEESLIKADAPAEEAPAPAPIAKEPEKPAKTLKTVKGAKNEAQIKAALDAMAKKLVAQSARTIVPNRAHPEYKQAGKEWVATFIDVDTNNVRTELKPGLKGQYVGFIRYQERHMQCRGATKKAALTGDCQQIKTRNLNEMIRYDGKEWQD